MYICTRMSAIFVITRENINTIINTSNFRKIFGGHHIPVEERLQDKNTEHLALTELQFYGKVHYTFPNNEQLTGLPLQS